MGKTSGRLLALGLIICFFGFGCERLAWRAANQKHTPAGYREYLAKYPKGDHAKTARKRLDGLVFMGAMQTRTLEGFQEYLRDFPQGDYVGRARKQVSALARARADKLSPDQVAAARIVVETSLGQFVIRLRPEQAPKHCRSLIALAATGFYDEMKINAAEPGRLVKMGDPVGDGMGGPGYMIPFEANDGKHVRGAVAMWHLPVDVNTAGSQFFICLAALPEFDGKYTVFGEVVSGLTVVDRIAAVPTTGPQGRPPFRPRSPVIIDRVRLTGINFQIETQGPGGEPGGGQ